MESSSERAGSGQTRLWRGYFGHTVLDKLKPYCVIDRTPNAEVGTVQWTVAGGGTRIASLRDLAPDVSVQRHYANFFQSLRSSVAEVGIKLPILVWGLNGQLYVRYGASRVHIARGLKFALIPSVACVYGAMPEGFYPVRELFSPAEVLNAFGPPREVGHFVVNHEMIDAHRMEY